MLVPIVIIAVSFAASANAAICGGYTSAECLIECSRKGYQSSSCTEDQCTCRSSSIIVGTACGGYTSSSCYSACNNDGYAEGICDANKCTCRGSALPQICGGYNSAECAIHCLKKGYDSSECTLTSCFCSKTSGTTIITRIGV